MLDEETSGFALLPDVPCERPGVTSFRTLMMDPPWNEAGGGVIKRGADRHYPLVKTRDLPGVILNSGTFEPANDSHLWMWATNNFLPDALWLGAQLGFEYKTNAVWVKTRAPSPDLIARELTRAHDAGAGESFSAQSVRLSEALTLQIGLGQYLRGAHELLLFFTRGKGQAPTVWNEARNVPSVIRARRTRHSAKPVEAYELIERVSAGPRVEFFARAGREGWTSWGNESPEGEDE